MSLMFNCEYPVSALLYQLHGKPAAGVDCPDAKRRIICIRTSWSRSVFGSAVAPVILVWRRRQMGRDWRQELRAICSAEPSGAHLRCVAAASRTGDINAQSKSCPPAGSRKNLLGTLCLEVVRTVSRAIAPIKELSEKKKKSAANFGLFVPKLRSRTAAPGPDRGNSIELNVPVADEQVTELLGCHRRPACRQFSSSTIPWFGIFLPAAEDFFLAEDVRWGGMSRAGTA